MRAKLYRGAWYVVWNENGETKRRALRTKNADDAKSKLEDFKRSYRPRASNISDIVDAYIADRKQIAARPDRIEHAWKALKPHFGHLRPDQVTRDLCRQYADARRLVTYGRRKSATKDGTVIKELGVLRAALQWHDRHSPAVFEMPSAPASRERHLTRAEYERLRAAAKPIPHLHLFVVLALATAGRSRAILELTWDRANHETGLIDLRKGGGRRKGRATVPMTPTAKILLQDARKAAMTDHVIEYGGKPVGSVKKAFARACREAELDGVTPHVLRHTAAVWMAEAGVTMPEIARYLGHSDSRLTERVYAKFSPGFLARAAQALE